MSEGSCFHRAGDKTEWQLQHAKHVEKALQAQAASVETVGHAVVAVRQDVQPGKVPDADFLVAAAEGVLFEGLAALLGQVNTMSQPLEIPSMQSLCLTRLAHVMPVFTRLATCMYMSHSSP